MAKRKHTRLCLAACFALALPACASLTPTGSAQTAAKKGLSAQNLGAGECGLFVWTADQNKRFVLFAQSQKMSGIWDAPSGETALVIKSQSGVPSQSQYPKQVYDALTLDLRKPQAIENGTRYRAGTLTQELIEDTAEDRAEGWTLVTSVVGLSACQHE